MGSSEFIKGEKAKFEAADVSGDGALSGGELRNFFNAYRSPAVIKQESKYFIRAHDGNSDGKLSFKEFRSKANQMEDEKELFKKLDSNGDSFLDAAEYED